MVTMSLNIQMCLIQLYRRNFGRLFGTRLQQEDHPNLIGYYWTDTPQWDLKRAQETRGTDWISTIRDLPEDSFGAKRYRKFIEEEGGTDEAFTIDRTRTLSSDRKETRRLVLIRFFW